MLCGVWVARLLLTRLSISQLLGNMIFQNHILCCKCAVQISQIWLGRVWGREGQCLLWWLNVGCNCFGKIFVLHNDCDRSKTQFSHHNKNLPSQIWDISSVMPLLSNFFVQYTRKSRQDDLHWRPSKHKPCWVLWVGKQMQWVAIIAGGVPLTFSRCPLSECNR